MPRSPGVPEVDEGPAGGGERAAAEEALRHSEQSVRMLLESLPDGVALIQDGHFVRVNAAYARLVGVASAQEMVGRPFATAVPPEVAQRVTQRLRHLEDTGHPTPPLEYRLRRPDGSEVFIEASATPLPHEGRLGVLILARDVTERRRMQARLMQADRLVSVGTLAGGVAHELNNPLAYVASSVRYCREELQRARERGWEQVDVPDLLEALEEAAEGAERMQVIVRDLRSFAHGDDERSERVDLRVPIEAALGMAWNEVKRRCRLVRDYAPLPPVLASEARLAQVVLNLVLNAAQAIPEGDVAAHEIRVSTRALGPEQVAIEVRDTGCGIPPENLPRIFDPFFTTRPPDAGAGLGLSICHRIVTALGGTIDVESEPGRGTTARVTLRPLSQEADAAAAQPPAPPAPRPAHPGRVLVVDDEPLILTAFRRLLGPQAEVVALQDPRDALERLRAGEAFDVVFCDLMMPGMTGIELHAALSECRPELARHMVFMTGGACTPGTHEFLERVPNVYLEKPFEPEAVRSLVRERLSPACAAA